MLKLQFKDSLCFCNDHGCVTSLHEDIVFLSSVGNPQSLLAFINANPVRNVHASVWVVWMLFMQRPMTLNCPSQ
jgi:hypothetical protein